MSVEPATEDKERVKTPLNPDLEYSLGVLNYLLSGYQGRFVFFKVLVDLGVPGVDATELQKSEDSLKKINQWFGDLLQGMPMFAAHWTTPGTFEAKKALDLLESLKPELRWLSDVSSKAVEVGDFASQPRDELRVLAACLARIKVVNHFYCLGNMKFGEVMKLEDFSAYYRGLEPRLLAEVEAAYAITLALTSPDTTLGSAFVAGFSSECALLSPVALTQVHDINILTARFRGGLSFLTVDIIEQEGAKWTNSGFNPIDAGYWRAYKFEPNEATVWKRIGLELPATAVVWRSLGFSATDAANWLRLGLDAGEAAVWSAKGFSPQEARSFKDRGISDPTKVPSGVKPQVK